MVSNVYATKYQAHSLVACPDEMLATTAIIKPAFPHTGASYQMPLHTLQAIGKACINPLRLKTTVILVRFSASIWKQLLFGNYAEFVQHAGISALRGR